ncbi:hypothetical protein QJS10_CPB12g01774 [Acorus calamus]|uniref:Uncharacterized protein n=1 Tax=Acorus calamus TaxID=4465 RepID=A0AAV9DNM6_ACOCL|nr:hypothetical protein QJS10_CPB12g01774 [Acorus calamus]
MSGSSPKISLLERERTRRAEGEEKSVSGRVLLRELSERLRWRRLSMRPRSGGTVARRLRPTMREEPLTPMQTPMHRGVVVVIPAGGEFEAGEGGDGDCGGGASYPFVAKKEKISEILNDLQETFNSGNVFGDVHEDLNEMGGEKQSEVARIVQFDGLKGSLTKNPPNTSMLRLPVVVEA